jgi:hypothetical protein
VADWLHCTDPLNRQIFIKIYPNFVTNLDRTDGILITTSTAHVLDSGRMQGQIEHSCLKCAVSTLVIVILKETAYIQHMHVTRVACSNVSASMPNGLTLMLRFVSHGTLKIVLYIYRGPVLQLALTLPDRFDHLKNMPALNYSQQVLTGQGFA